MAALRKCGWMLAPLACHFGFSWMGFVPTDDGWLPAVARRIADGEVPHRDFIFVRPALSALMQVPVVWWGGDHAIWLSRLAGWLVLGATCWLWSVRVAATEPWAIRFALYLGALMFCAHSFQVMAWHTLDGMLFATAGMPLAASPRIGRQRCGFVLAGLAVLCRQNFILFAPLLALARYGREFRGWLRAASWAAVPSIAYGATLAVLGGFPEFWTQVSAMQAQFGEAAVRSYIQSGWFVWGIAGGLAAMTIARRALGNALRWLPPLLFATATLGLAAALARSPMQFHSASTALLGFTLGASVRAWKDCAEADRMLLISGLGLGWVTSISIGYNSPAMAAGILWLLAWHTLRLGSRGANLRSALLCALPIAGWAFFTARTTFPYRDRAATELRYELAGILPGAAGIRTNELTFATLADLRGLTDKLHAQGRSYAILTDCSAHWIRSRQRNPLPSEWPQATELGYNLELFDTLVASMRRQPAGFRVILQKFIVSDYAWHFVEVPRGAVYYALQNWVAEHGSKVDETAFFEVYTLR